SYQRNEFQVTIANWMVSGSALGYQVAGPGSRRIEDTDPDLIYTGTWGQGAGNFSGGTIHHTSAAGASVSCSYQATQTHQLYLGTHRAINDAQITVVIDNNPATSHNLVFDGADMQVRIPLGTFSGQTPHTVTITHAGSTGTHVFFDFLELAVPTNSLPVVAP